MSPILVRPVREQLEHDRVIRLLHAKNRRRFEVGMNPGAEQNTAVGAPGAAMYPDLVLQSQERGRRVEAVVEVETGESVNHLEALAEWAHFGRLRSAFHLYVPSNMVDVARRLCEDNHIRVSEIWSYHSIGEDVRFALIHKSKEEPLPEPEPAPRRVAAKAPAAKKKAAAAPKPAKSVKPAKTAAKAVKASKGAAKVAKTGAPKRAAARPATRSTKAAAPPRRKAATPAKKKPAARAQKRK